MLFRSQLNDLSESLSNRLAKLRSEISPRDGETPAARAERHDITFKLDVIKYVLSGRERIKRYNERIENGEYVSAAECPYCYNGHNRRCVEHLSDDELSDTE